MKKKTKITIIILLIVLLIGGVVLSFFYVEKQKEEERLRIKEQEKKTISDITNHYSENVVVNKSSNLYTYDNSEYRKIGTVEKDEIFSLDEVEITKDTKYFKIKDTDWYISYEDVEKTANIKEIDTRYKNYVPFMEKIKTDNEVTLYRNDKNVYNFNFSLEGQIIKKDDNGAYIEFQNELFFIKNEDIVERNTIEGESISATSIPVTVYHFFYKDDDNTCQEIICHSETQIRSHFDYLKNNGYFTINTKEMQLFLEEKIRLPEKSILITIDDGARAEYFVPVLEEYKINATLFLVTSWYEKEKFASNYLEIASHTDNLHTPGVCSGGQGSPLKCLDKEKLLLDLKTSREKLNNTEAFCYPFYEFNDYAVNAVEEAGFKTGFIGGQIKAKLGVNPYKIPRITIHKTTSLNQYINYIR